MAGFFTSPDAIFLLVFLLFSSEHCGNRWTLRDESVDSTSHPTSELKDDNNGRHVPEGREKPKKGHRSLNLVSKFT